MILSRFRTICRSFVPLALLGVGSWKHVFSNPYQTSKKKKINPQQALSFLLSPILPIRSVYGIFTYIWLIFMVSVGKIPFPWILGDQKGKKEFVAQKLAMDKAPYTKKKHRVILLRTFFGMVK